MLLLISAMVASHIKINNMETDCSIPYVYVHTINGPLTLPLKIGCVVDVALPYFAKKLAT